MKSLNMHFVKVDEQKIVIFIEKMCGGDIVDIIFIVILLPECIISKAQGFTFTAEYLKWINFRVDLFSRMPTMKKFEWQDPKFFAWINFREKSKNSRKFTKINPREI